MIVEWIYGYNQLREYCGWNSAIMLMVMAFGVVNIMIIIVDSL